MNYTNLGKSDLKVSRICMGCMGFGNAATGQHSWRNCIFLMRLQELWRRTASKKQEMWFDFKEIYWNENSLI